MIPRTYRWTQGRPSWRIDGFANNRADVDDGRNNPLLRLATVGDNAAMPTEPTKAEPPKGKRRWFQFSLRTLLIGVMLLAVACAYVAHEKAIVDRRSELWRWLNQHGSQIRTDGGMPVPEGIEQPSFLRRLLGDQTVLEVYLRQVISDDDLQRIKETFPGVRITQAKR